MTFRTESQRSSNLARRSHCCPVCQQVGKEAWKFEDYPIVECASCTHRFCGRTARPDHVKSIYDDDYFSGGGAGYSQYTSEEELLTRHGERYGELLRPHMKPGKLLAVGAAAGFVMKGFANRGWTTMGLEPNASMAKCAFDSFGFDVQTGDLEDYSAATEFDLVTMIQVIGHFHNVNKALVSAEAATRDGGYWLIECWNYRSLTARLFGKQWHEYSPPSVLNWFSPQSLERICEKYGMHRVASGRPKKFLDGAHAKSLLRYRLEQSALGKMLVPAIQLIPDRAKLRYPAEDLFWMLFQKK